MVWGENKRMTINQTDSNPPGRSQGTAANIQRQFTQRVLIVVGIVLAIGILLLFLWSAADILLLVFAGVLLATVLRGFSNILSEHTPISPGWALTIVSLALIALIGVSTWLLAPGVAEQFVELQASLPVAIEQVEEYLEQYPWVEEVMTQLPQPTELIPGVNEVLSQAAGIFSTTMGILIGSFIIVFGGIYFAVNPGMYINGIVQLVPHRGRSRAGEVLYAVGKILWWWLIGRLLSMLVVGVTVTISLWLLGIPLALTLGLLAALLDFIPNLGPTLATVPAVLLALMQSPTQALYVLLLYIVIQQAESYLLTPIVQHRTVSLPPALTIIAQVILGVLFGVMGLILASPLAAVVLVLIKMLYVEDVLGDTMEDLPDLSRVAEANDQRDGGIKLAPIQSNQTPPRLPERDAIMEGER